MKAPAAGGAATVVKSWPFLNAQTMAINGSFLYWADVSGNVIKAPLTGATPATLTTVGDVSIQNLTTTSTGIYWTANGQSVDTQSVIMSIAPDGGSLSVLADLGAGGTFGYAAEGIAVDSKNVYWTGYYPAAGDNQMADDVSSVVLAGGTASTLESESANEGNGLGPIAVSGGQLYWTDLSSGCNVDGGTCETVVLTANVTGGATTTLATAAPSIVNSLLIDSLQIYWTASACDMGSNCTGYVMKAPIGGGTVTTLASNQTNPWGIAVDATSVYWTDQGSDFAVDGTVMKLTPK